MAKYLPLPDGSSVTIREGETPQQTWLRALEEYPEAFGFGGQAAAPAAGPREGILASLQGGAERLLSTGRTALGAIVDPEAAAQAGIARGQDISSRIAPGADLEKVKQVYRERGLLPAAGEVISQIPSALAEQAPQIAATLGTAKAGALAGAKFGPKGAIAGGLTGAVAPSLLQLFGSNIERQAAEQQEAGAPVDISRSAALAAAVPAAGLEVAATFIPFGRTMVGKILGPNAERALGTATGREMVNQGLTRTLTQGAATGIAAEVPTEVIQQMLERAQAGLDLTSDEALAEYGQAAYGAALVGAPVGAGGRFYQRSAQRGEQAAEEQQRALEEQQRRMAEEEARAEQERQEREAYESSPEYLLDIEKRFLDTRGQLAELQRQKRKVDSKSETAEEDREFNKQLEAQIKALREETGYKDLLSQYTTLRPRIERAKEQAALDALSPEEFMLRQQGLGVDTRRPFKREKPVPLSAAAEKGADVSGIAPAQPMLPAEVPLFYAQQQIEAANRQAREQAISDQPELAMAGFDAAEGVQATGQQIIEALTTDLGMANTLLRTRPQLPGMSRSQSKLVLDGLQKRLDQIGAEIDAGRQQAQARREAIEAEIQALRDMRARTDGSDVARMRQLAVRERELGAELAEIEQQAAMTRDAEAQLGLFEDGLEVPEQELPAGMEAVPLSRRRRIGNVEVDGALPLPQQIRQLKQQRAAAVQTRNNALVNDIDEAIEILREGEPAEREAAPTGQVADLQAALADMARSTEPEGRQPAEVPETTSPDMLEDLIARADQNPELPLQDQMLLEQVRDELPVLSRMQPIGEAEGLTPARPLDIVSSWLYRSNTGNPSPEARREVEDLLARIEQGKRSETEQVRQAAGRELTPQEQRQLRGTSLEGRRGIMTREDTGETRRQVQTDLAEEDLGTIFQDFVDFDNFMASEGLAQLRDSQELFGETAARTAKLVAPLQNRVAEINARMAELRQRIVAARTVAVDQRNQARALVEEERAKVAKILVEADKPLAAFDAAYLQAYFNLAQATTARADLTREMRDNAAQLEARIAAFETNQANKQALQKASKEFKQALETLVSERQKEQDALRVLNTSRFPDYQAYFKAKEGRLNKEGMAELQAKAEAAHKAVAAAMKAIDPTLRLDSKVFKDFLIKEAALTEQLRANARRLGGLTVARNRAKKAMLDARAEVFNDPALVKRIEDAKLDEQTAEILLQSAIANENVDVNNFVRTLEQQIQELQPFADTLATRIKELNRAAEIRRDARVAKPEARVDEGERRRAEQARLEVLQGTRAEALGLLDRIEVTFPKDKGARLDTDTFMNLLENKTFANSYAAVAPADKKQEAVEAARVANEAYNNFVEEQTGPEKERAKKTASAVNAFLKADNALREKKKDVADLEAEKALAQEQIDARAQEGKAPLKKQTDKLAAMDRKIAKATAEQEQMAKAVRAALDKVKKASGVQATYKEDPQSARRFADAEEQIAAIAAGQTSRRVTSPVTRSSSPAPTQFRTESPESRAGTSKADVDRRAKESTQPQPRDTKVSKKEQREANRIAEEQRGKGTGQKVAGITEAEVERATLTATKAGMKSEPKKLPAEFAEANKIAAALRNPKKKENNTLLRQEVEKARNTARELKELFDESDFSEGDFDALESAVRDTVYDSRPTYDLRANTVEAVEDGRILDALQTLESNGSTDFVKQLAARLRPLVMRTKLRVVDNLTNQKGVPVEGLFSPENNTVFLDRNGLNEESFLHEVTHAVTVNTIDIAEKQATEGQMSRRSFLKAATATVAAAQLPSPTSGMSVDQKTDLLEKAVRKAVDQVNGLLENVPRALADKLNKGQIDVLANFTKNRDLADLLNRAEQDAFVDYEQYKDTLRGLVEKHGDRIFNDLSDGFLEAQNEIESGLKRQQEQQRTRLTQEQMQAYAELKELYQQIQGEAAFKNEYAKKDLKEFVSELMSNEKVRAKLDQRNFIQRLYDAILRLIGMAPSQTRSERAVENAYAIFAPSKPSQGAVVASMLRGVMPKRDTEFGANVPASVANTINRTVGRNPTVVDRIMANVSGLAFRTQILDRYAPIERLLEKGVEKGMLTGNQSFQTQYFLRFGEQRNQYVAQAASSAVPQLIKSKEGEFTIEAPAELNEKTGANLRNIAMKLQEAGIGNEQATEQMFTTYLAILRAEQDGTGYDKLNFENPLTPKEAAEVKNFVQSNPKIRDAFEAARKEYRDYNNNLLDLMQQTGALDKETVAKLKAKEYVPYYRNDNGIVNLIVGSEKPVRIGNIIDQPYLKELVGGKEKILPFFTGAMQNTAMLMDMSLRNMQTKETAVAMSRIGVLESRNGITFFDGEGPADPRRKINFKIDGKLKHAFVTDATELYGVPADLLVQGMSGIKIVMPAALSFLAIPANVLRKMVTRAPVYALRQPIRESINGWMVTGGNFTPVVSAFRELAKIMQGKSATERTLQGAGAISSNVFTGDIQDIQMTLRDISAGQSGWEKLMTRADTLAVQGDAATRAVLYDTYRKQGMTHMQALLGALEVMNFGRRGLSPSIQMMSMMVPFFSAQIQGMDVIYRSMAGKSTFEQQMNARRKLFARGMMMAGMTMAYAAMMEDDEAYKNATPEQRALNWFVYFPGIDEPVKIPIPFELGYIFKALPELFMNVASGDTKAEDAAKTFGKLAYNTVPLGLPQAIKPGLEVMMNYSLFTGAPIESAREQTLLTEERFRSNTTELAKALGQFGVVSPVQIDYLIRGYTGGLGIAIASIPNFVVRPFTMAEDVELPEKRLSQNVLIGGLFQPVDGRAVIDAAYKEVDSMQKASQTYKRMIEQGRRADAQKFAQEYSREIALASFGGTFRQQMGEFAALRRQVEAAPGMSAQEKRAKLDQIRQLEIRLAQKIRELAKAGE